MSLLSKLNPFRFPTEEEELKQEYERLMREEELAAAAARRIEFQRHMARAAMQAMDEWRAKS